jgi:hypothetical protein
MRQYIIIDPTRMIEMLTPLRWDVIMNYRSDISRRTAWMQMYGMHLEAQTALAMHAVAIQLTFDPALDHNPVTLGNEIVELNAFAAWNAHNKGYNLDKIKHLIVGWRIRRNLKHATEFANRIAWVPLPSLLSAELALVTRHLRTALPNDS